MKKLLSVLTIVLLTSCGGASTIVPSNDTTYRVDSLKGIPVVDAEKQIDTSKEIK